MVKIKAFPAYRPDKNLAEKAAALPYDVMNTAEAKEMVEGNPVSFLNVTRPETGFPDNQNPYDSEVYAYARDTFQKMINDKVYIQDNNPYFYIYRQIMNGRGQVGLVACSSIEDYFSDKIKKHEYTRPEKEEDRKQHIKATRIHSGPVFLTYKKVDEISAIIHQYQSETEPEYDFTAEDGVQHTVWLIQNQEDVDTLQKLFESKVPATYIADGHHRAASSAKAGKEMEENGSNNESDEHKFFLTVLFPDDELEIMDYNRMVKDLNGYSAHDFLEKLKVNFEINEISQNELKPGKSHEFGMYLDGKSYRLTAKSHTFDDNDPIKCLDVTVLQDHLLSPFLNINDPRTDKRIDFVGGIRGMDGLRKRVDSGEMKVAFALYPVSIRQLIEISDAGKVMPPKSTWFEPKLRSGLLVHGF